MEVGEDGLELAGYTAQYRLPAEDSWVVTRRLVFPLTVAADRILGDFSIFTKRTVNVRRAVSGVKPVLNDLPVQV